MRIEHPLGAQSAHASSEVTEASSHATPRTLASLLAASRKLDTPTHSVTTSLVRRKHTPQSHICTGANSTPTPISSWTQPSDHARSNPHDESSTRHQRDLCPLDGIESLE
jgi:hypothetical protein